MEITLLYFLLGCNIGTVIFVFKEMKQINRREKELVQDFKHRDGLVKELQNEIKSTLFSVDVMRKNMEADSYEDISKVNKRLDNLDTASRVLIDRLNTIDKSNQGEFKTLHTLVQNLNGELNSLREDPNFLNRY
jgi:hypothetical protein